MRLRSGGILTALAVLFVTARAAAGQLGPQYSTEPSGRTEPSLRTEPATKEVRTTFADLGVGSMSLEGVESAGAVNFGVRKDELVVGGVLHLRLTYSPSLIQDLSHVRVSLNGQTVAAVTLTKADAGHEVERSIPLDPRYFSDYNRIELDLIAHYTTGCEDPQQSSLWARVSGDSDVTLSLRPLELRDDLAFLPAPFFDAHDNRRLILPIVLPTHPSRDMVRSAGVAASWFGMLADYRGARFPVSFDALPSRHAMVFATNDSRPASLALSPVEAPTVSVIDDPADPSIKLLVFQGKDESQLRQAVEGVVLGEAVLSGSSATVGRVNYERRVAYDAPRWVRSDRPVRLGELVDDPAQLQGRGVAPQAMTVNLRLPPDLFTWNKTGVPVDVHYRYTAPAESDNSALSVSVNNQLLRSYRLAPQSEASAGSRLLVPLLQDDSSRETRGLLIPAFQLASDNQMVFQFSMDFHREADCKEVFIDDTREAIDPDSTIDVSGFAHYTALPNLDLFIDSGFPFTRYADLSETAIVLPDTTDTAALEELFFLLGRMGRQTGAVALAYQLLDAPQALAAKDVDLLILSGHASNDLLDQWGGDLPLAFTKLGREYRPLVPVSSAHDEPTTYPVSDRSASPRLTIRADGVLAALMSFESPLRGGRTVVALVGNNAEAERSLLSALQDEGKTSLMHGALAVLRGDAVQSFRPDDIYYVGSLPWWQWLWFHFSRHALLLIVMALVMAVAVGLLLYGGLQRRVGGRLHGRGRPGQ
jgi:cellulose synthase operon protein B